MTGSMLTRHEVLTTRHVQMRQETKSQLSTFLGGAFKYELEKCHQFRRKLHARGGEVE